MALVIWLDLAMKRFVHASRVSAPPLKKCFWTWSAKRSRYSALRGSSSCIHCGLDQVKLASLELGNGPVRLTWLLGEPSVCSQSELKKRKPTSGLVRSRMPNQLLGRSLLRKAERGASPSP